MRRNEIEQDADPDLARGCDQRIKVLDSPEVQVSAAKIRDVVAPVTVRRREGRVKPDAVEESQWRYKDLGEARGHR